MTMMRVTRWVCDRPGCKESEESQDGDRPFGWGSVLHPHGGNNGDVCRSCIFAFDDWWTEKVPAPAVEPEQEESAR